MKMVNAESDQMENKSVEKLMGVANKKLKIIEWKSFDKWLVETMSKEEMKEEITMPLEKRLGNKFVHTYICTYVNMQKIKSLIFFIQSLKSYDLVTHP